MIAPSAGLNGPSPKRVAGFRRTEIGELTQRGLLDRAGTIARRKAIGGLLRCKSGEQVQHNLSPGLPLPARPVEMALRLTSIFSP